MLKGKSKFSVMQDNIGRIGDKNLFNKILPWIMTPRLATSVSTHSYYRRVFMLRGNKRNFKSKNRVIEKKKHYLGAKTDCKKTVVSTAAFYVDALLETNQRCNCDS